MKCSVKKSGNGSWPRWRLAFPLTTTGLPATSWKRTRSGANLRECILHCTRRKGFMSSPQRGEIWFTKLPTDPPEKGRRPVVIVSVNARNNHPRANTVLVVPLSTSVDKSQTLTHIVLEPGQTGLRERSVAKAENVATISKI